MLGGFTYLTPTCSIRILAYGVGLDKKKLVHNLKTCNILRVSVSLRIDSHFIAQENDFWLIIKSECGIYWHEFLLKS